MMVELVIPRHVDDGPIRESGLYPAQAAHADTNIAGKDDDIGIGDWRLKIFEFGVQVIQNMKFHDTTLAHKQKIPHLAGFFNYLAMVGLHGLGPRIKG